MTAFAGLVAGEPSDEALVAAVHPAHWLTPTPPACYDLVVIGGGTAGLVAAAGAAGLGARVALVERHLLGGDCLNVGCVPSKALLHAARVVQGARAGAAYGLRAADALPDFGAVMTTLRARRAHLARHDAAARFRDLGVDVFLGAARFAGTDRVEVAGTTLRFARAVIATGARAAAPLVPGLADAGYLTHETVFGLVDRPRRLIVIGAGPIGCELAQAFCRLGSEVTVLARDPGLLPKEDRDAAAIVERRLAAEGVRFELGVELVGALRRGADKVVVYRRGDQTHEVAADELLVAVGRAANIEGLDLEAARVEFDRKGVTVDDRLRTSNRRIFAAGDVCSPYQFTHAADAMARLVLRNALFFGRARASALVIPWATCTSPEVAHVGVSAAAAAARGLTTHAVALADVDRAFLEDDTEGFVRIHADRKGRIHGATIVAANAGDLIGEVALAMTHGLGLGALSSTIHPYPTRAEALRKLGDAYQRTRLTPRVKRWLARIIRWRRR